MLFILSVTFSINAQVVLNEVFYDASGSDDGLEWVELYNTSGSDIDLGTYSLGFGGTDYIYGTLQLSGTIPANGFFVVGGPTSNANNHNPTFDQALDFNPDLQNSGSIADGVALFDVLASNINSSTIPIDALIYGTTNSNNLMDESGNPGLVDVGDAPAGSSIARTPDGGNTVDIDNSPSPNSTNDSPAPIHLSSFTAKPMDTKTVSLDWSTANEENNEYFSIEHSTNGRDFISIDQVEGAFNSTETQYYNYQHKEAAKGMNYYRLRQVDTDGTFSFSPIAAVTLASDVAVEVSPTIAESSVQLLINEGLEKEATIEVYNVLGRLVISQVFERGATQTDVDINKLQKGHYFIKLVNGPETQISRFIKQ